MISGKTIGLSGLATLAMAAAVSAQTLPAPEPAEEGVLSYDSTCGTTVLQASHDIDGLWSLITETSQGLEPSFVEDDILGYRQLQELMNTHWSGDNSIRNQLIENMGAVCAPEQIGEEDKSVERAALDQCVSAIDAEIVRIETNIGLFEDVDPMDSVYLDIAARTLIQTMAESYENLYEGCGEPSAIEDVIEEDVEIFEPQ